MAVLCTDIDGTLLDAQRALSPRTVAAVRAVRAAGHVFMLCSSRMPSSMRLLERSYGALGTPLIAYNGGLVLSPEGAVILDEPIPAAAARRIYDLCSGLGVHGSFFSGNDWHAWADDQWTTREEENTWVAPRAERADWYVESGRVDVAPPHKVMCMGASEGIDAIEAALAEDGDVVTYRSKPTYLEIGSSRCDKGTGLQALEDELGVTAGDCWFFGDNVNDLPAFAVVGTSVAVANAKEAVLKAATVVTARNHDDGVARYLESWLAEQPAALP
jgi:Cof subfamily protein (haloacid dehalogenase superfamily)